MEIPNKGQNKGKSSNEKCSNFDGSHLVEFLGDCTPLLAALFERSEQLGSEPRQVCFVLQLVGEFGCTDCPAVFWEVGLLT
ncbi:hypothetical protein PsorP6_013715 [Peronosclerospora sorghi]|uniref:Uncharacterized protein n=1 Tax=Peronosclerospora sorghi TaxID=230839 RepID=A0ACC0VIC7_9STRA|nr:hypothetical protein PsorP6_013715 [Peronosclerospora sorghi]